MRIIFLGYVFTSVLTRQYYGKYWLTAAKWQYGQSHDSAYEHGTASVLSTRIMGGPCHISSVMMTCKVNTRKPKANKLNATDCTVWFKVRGSLAEDILHALTTDCITGCLKANINLNYI